VIASLYLFAALAVADAPQPPPLTEEQLTKVRTLVKSHQEEQAKLKAQLEKAQKKLADCYSRYELKEEDVKTLQDEILDVQGKLLKSYHSMQKELRSIVGPERFLVLSRRIDNALRNPPPEPKK
jgi:septal ring factor EnvC (AmiA/AmiB activator)